MLVVGTLVAIPAIQGIFDELGTEETLPAVTLWFADFINKAIKYWYLPSINNCGCCSGSIILY
ncbi:MAG: hypothetical protein V8R82_01110 [Clostridia bacterium]